MSGPEAHPEAQSPRVGRDAWLEPLSEAEGQRWAMGRSVWELDRSAPPGVQPGFRQRYLTWGHPLD